MKKSWVGTFLILSMLNSKAMGASFESCQKIMSNFFEKERRTKTLREEAAKIDLTQYGFKNTLKDREKFEKLFVKCNEPGVKEFDQITSRKINYTFNAISVGTMVGGYTYSNWDKPKDVEWFFRLGLGISFGSISGHLQTKLIKETGDKYKDLVFSFLYGRSADAVFMKIDEKLITKLVKKEEDLFKIKIANSDKKTQEAYARYQKLISDKDYYEKFRSNILASYTYLDTVNLGIGKIGDKDFNQLTNEDLKDREVQNVVIASLIAEAKRKLAKENAVIHTGSNELDIFIFDSLYNAFKIPKDIVVNHYTSKIICMNMYNPTRGFTFAVGLNVLNQILFADYFGATYRLLKYELVGSEDNVVEKSVKLK